MDLRPSPFSLRIDDILMKKFKVIAAEHKRSATKEIELLIEQAVEQYEKEHGQIFVPWQNEK